MLSIYFYTTLLEVTGIRNFPISRSVQKVKAHPSLQKGGCNEVHDIEDLVKVGQSVKG
jgi:hypothetical protein